MPREDWLQALAIIYVTIQFGLGTAIVLGHIPR
jgi:hypothetical protein